MRVLAAEPCDFKWLVDRTDCGVSMSFRAIKAVDERGRIHGMVGYDNWTLNAVQAHMAVDAPIVWRHLLGPAFAYPFEECGKGLIIAVVPANNRKSVELAEHFGFERVAEIQDGWAKGVPLVTLQLRRENCRFLAENKRAA